MSLRKLHPRGWTQWGESSEENATILEKKNRERLIPIKVAGGWSFQIH